MPVARMRHVYIGDLNICPGEFSARIASRRQAEDWYAGKRYLSGLASNIDAQNKDLP
jgi:hypothetical protein